MLCLARLIRGAIVASGTKNACPTSTENGHREGTAHLPTHASEEQFLCLCQQGTVSGWKHAIGPRFRRRTILSAD